MKTLAENIAGEFFKIDCSNSVGMNGGCDCEAGYCIDSDKLKKLKSIIDQHQAEMVKDLEVLAKEFMIGVDEPAWKYMAKFASQFIREDEWISVQDRLPESGTDVLMYCPTSFPKNIGISTGEYIEGVFVCDANEVIHRDVTHWKPLPPLPKTK